MTISADWRPSGPRRHRRALRTAVALAAACALALGTVACGGDAATPGGAEGASGGSTPRGTGRTAAELPPPDGAALPPGDLAELAAIYDPLLEPLGVHLTRGALIDLSEGGYVPSDSGTHLALYVAPDETFTDEQFAEHIAPMASLITPDVFARWPGLESYDICQEGPDIDGDPATLPETMTQINIQRAGLSMLDWPTAELVDILTVVPTTRAVTLSVKIDVRRTQVFTEAQRAATAAAGTATTTAPAEPGPSKLSPGTSTTSTAP